MKDEIEKLGEPIFALKSGELIKGYVLAVRKEVRLNTGSDMHGRTLPAEISYLVRNKQVKDVWVKSTNSVFDKTKIHELIRE